MYIHVIVREKVPGRALFTKKSLSVQIRTQIPMTAHLEERVEYTLGHQCQQCGLKILYCLEADRSLNINKLSHKSTISTAAVLFRLAWVYNYIGSSSGTI